MRRLGEDVSETLEYSPARFKVIRRVRPKLSRGGCERIVQAPAASRAIERGPAGPGLPAHVLTAKYGDHLPLYRQAEIHAREGVELERSPPAAWFAYSPDRKGERPEAHLAGFEGTLHADAYAGFNGVYANGKVREAACWARVRRKFFDIEQAHSSRLAAETLARIGELYGIEKEIRGSPAEQRRRARQARAKPLLEALRAWL